MVAHALLSQDPEMDEGVARGVATREVKERRRKAAEQAGVAEPGPVVGVKVKLGAKPSAEGG